MQQQSRLYKSSLSGETGTKQVDKKMPDSVSASTLISLQSMFIMQTLSFPLPAWKSSTCPVLKAPACLLNHTLSHTLPPFLAPLHWLPFCFCSALGALSISGPFYMLLLLLYAPLIPISCFPLNMACIFCFPGLKSNSSSSERSLPNDLCKVSSLPIPTNLFPSQGACSVYTPMTISH